MSVEQREESTELSQEQLERVLGKVAKVTGLGEILNREHVDTDEVIQYLNARKSVIDEKWGKGVKGVQADEEEACRRLPELLETGEVSILDLRAIFLPEEAQAVTEPVQVRKTLLLWAQIGSLFRRGR